MTNLQQLIEKQRGELKLRLKNWVKDVDFWEKDIIDTFAKSQLELLEGVREELLSKLSKFQEKTIQEGAEEMSDVYIGKLATISEMREIINSLEITNTK